MEDSLCHLLVYGGIGLCFGPTAPACVFVTRLSSSQIKSSTTVSCFVSSISSSTHLIPFFQLCLMNSAHSCHHLLIVYLETFYLSRP